MPLRRWCGRGGDGRQGRLAKLRAPARLDLGMITPDEISVVRMRAVPTRFRRGLRYPRTRGTARRAGERCRPLCDPPGDQHAAIRQLQIHPSNPCLALQP